MDPSRRLLWWNRVTRFAAGSSWTIIIAVSSVVRMKWLALHLETAGIGIIAQTFAAQAWMGNVSSLGLGLPVTRLVAAAVGGRDNDDARHAVWTALAFVAMALVPVVIALNVFAEPLAHLLLGSRTYATLLRISTLGVLGIGAYPIIQGLCAGRADVRSPMAFALAGAGGATLLTFALIPRYGLAGAVWAAAALYPIGVAAMLWWHLRRYPGALRPRPSPLVDPAMKRRLFAMAGATFALPLLDQGTLLLLRSHFLHEHGAAANGLLQAALAVSQQSGVLFYAYLASYALGTITALGAANGAEAIQAYTRKQWAPLVGTAALLLAVAMIAATPLLRLLYSSRFDPAGPMMAYTIVGEFGRVCLQAVALGSLPLGGASLWFRIGILQPLTLAAAYAFFVSIGAGPLSLPRAYAVAGAASFLGGAWMMARAGSGLRLRDLGLAAAGYAFLLALLAALA